MKPTRCLLIGTSIVGPDGIADSWELIWLSHPSPFEGRCLIGYWSTKKSSGAIPRWLIFLLTLGFRFHKLLGMYKGIDAMLGTNVTSTCHGHSHSHIIIRTVTVYNALFFSITLSVPIIKCGWTAIAVTRNETAVAYQMHGWNHGLNKFR